jgi:hypothetical protein
MTSGSGVAVITVSYRRHFCLSYVPLPLPFHLEMLVSCVLEEKSVVIINYLRKGISP